VTEGTASIGAMSAQAPEEPNPYGSAGQPTGGAEAAPGGPPAAGASPSPRRVRIPHLHAMKTEGRRWAMLTAYDMYAAQIFDEAGIPVLLVGDSAGNNVYGYETTVPVTLEEMVPLVRAVSSAARRALVVAGMPFGSYGASVEQGFTSAVRLMKEGLAHAVKLEGGSPMVPLIRALTDAGIPVMAHLGFTPQSEHQLGGYRVQGRGDAAEELIAEARAVQDAGAFSVVLEMVPAPVAARVTEALAIPTIGIGAGNGTDAQVLVWSDFAGLRSGKAPRFVKKYADLRGTLIDAAQAYAADVESGAFPAAEHSFES
jgi:3-methyl-2-oxobutanoate hydroxymethyltransferase